MRMEVFTIIIIVEWHNGETIIMITLCHLSNNGTKVHGFLFKRHHQPCVGLDLKEQGLHILKSYLACTLTKWNLREQTLIRNYYRIAVQRTSSSLLIFSQIRLGNWGPTYCTAQNERRAWARVGLPNLIEHEDLLSRFLLLQPTPWIIMKRVVVYNANRLLVNIIIIIWLLNVPY